ncbi:hypothetical protein LJC19_03935 [Oxalobacter sp. OttesenSCG-928-P03]|nr:hypothetical protein [Oxalobacter sp. OttesenSCG-928-P03]
MKKTIALFLAAAMLLAGCASSGVDVDQEDISSLKPGITTEKDVIARFGPPTSTEMLQNGRKMLIYTHTESSMRAWQALPIVFVLTGGPDKEVTAAELIFSRDGLYLSHKLVRGEEAEEILEKEKAEKQVVKAD